MFALYAIVALVAYLTTTFESVESCTVIAFGKNTTTDNSVLIAHTDDAGMGAADLRLVNVPAMDHPKNSTRAVYNLFGGYPRVVTKQLGPHYLPKEGEVLSKPLGHIPQVEHTYAYFDQDYGMMNEVQLSIAESTCPAKTVGWASDVPYGFNMFGIAELSKIALERCDNARCAVKTMGDLSVKYGFYSEDSGNPNMPGYGDSAESLVISDKYGEAWVFHVLTGPKNASAVWGAQRLPDDHVTVIANAFIIREMDLKDSDNFMGSDNMLTFAQEMGWWNPSKGPFDFAAAYTFDEAGPVLPLYAGRRVWRVFDLVAPSLKLDSTLGFVPTMKTYPFSVKPDNKLNLTNLMSMLKDHYEGTPYDMTKGVAAGPFGSPIRYDGPAFNVNGGWERPIAMYRTMFSFVLQTRTNLPDAVGGVAWYSQSSPHGSFYIPFSCAQHELPQSYLEGKQSKFSTKSSWWAFNFVNNWSMLRFDRINADVRKEANQMQEKAFALQMKVEKEALKLNKESEMVAYLQKEYNYFAENAVSKWWDFAWSLIGKYSDGYVTTGEKPTEMQIPGYPSWWLQVSDFSKWPGDTFKFNKATRTPVVAATVAPVASPPQKVQVVHSPSFLSAFSSVLMGAVGGAGGLMLVQRYRRQGYHLVN